jgi:hypothetical protein
LQPIAIEKKALEQSRTPIFVTGHPCEYSICLSLLARDFAYRKSEVHAFDDRTIASLQR